MNEALRLQCIQHQTNAALAHKWAVEDLGMEMEYSSRMWQWYAEREAKRAMAILATLQGR